MLVASSNTVPDPHLEFVSRSDIVVSLVTSFDGCTESSTVGDIVFSNPPPKTTAPPITAKITKTPTTSKIFFLFPLPNLFSFNLLVTLSKVFLVDSSFTSGFFMSLPQLRQNFEFTGIDFPHFQQ